jgi:hypothetical protein
VASKHINIELTKDLIMILTVKTVTNWAVAQQVASLVHHRQLTIARLVSEGKTDGVAHPLSATSWQMNWINQAAAEEYVAALNQLVLDHPPAELTSITISTLGSVIEAAPVVV